MTNSRKFWTLRYIIINATYFAVYSGIHAYASVFLLEKGFSNTLIGILLEAQAGGRIEGTPWLQEAYGAEEKIHVPKSEEELFAELYQQQKTSEE